jgi:hypothetical protein
VVSCCEYDQSGEFCWQYFERPMKAGFSSMTPCMCETVFFSAADGSLFRVTQDADATPELYASIGRTMKISALAHAMICGAAISRANLLLDFVGVEYARTVSAGSKVDWG